jgi:hypothetical protein
LILEGERMKIHVVLLEIARNDLQAAEWLFRKKLYAQSVFYTEQSVEKALKSVGIWRGEITLEEAKEYRHRPLRYYFRVFREIKNGLDALRKLSARYPAFSGFLLKVGGPQMKREEIGFEELWNLLETYEKENKRKDDRVEEEKAFRIAFSKKRLCKYVVWWHTYEEWLSRYQKALRKVNPEDVRDSLRDESLRRVKVIAKMLPKLVAELSPEPKLAPVDIEKVKGEIKKQVTTRIAIQLVETEIFRIELEFCLINSLLYLATVFYPHATRSRYPDSGFNPLSIYTSRMPLIQMLGQLIRIAGKTLERIDRIYVEVSPFHL